MAFTLTSGAKARDHSRVIATNAALVAQYGELEPPRPKAETDVVFTIAPFDCRPIEGTDAQTRDSGAGIGGERTLASKPDGEGTKCNM